MQILDEGDILFIINPNSGSKKGTDVVDQINTLGTDIACIVTQNLDDLEEAFNSNIEKYKVFIVVGGDGTVNEAIKYLVKRDDKILGVLPAGSGNGFSRELGFNKSLESLIEDAKKGESKKIDILSINDDQCINASGLGFDSFVAHQFQHSKRRGLANYILASAKSVFTFKPFYATLKVDNEVIEDRFQMITIANTRQFGNNAIIAPQAKPDDGQFDLVLVKPKPFYMYPMFLIRLFAGTLKDSKYLKYIKVHQSLVIESDFKKHHVDGEPRFFKDKLSINIHSHKVRILKRS